jgi:hypothetical protein
VRGDSIRDLYAKSLALVGLSVLAGAGALVDYWPVGVGVPALEEASSTERFPLPGPLAVDAVGAPAAPVFAAAAPAAIATDSPVAASRQMAALSQAPVSMTPAASLPIRSALPGGTTELPAPAIAPLDPEPELLAISTVGIPEDALVAVTALDGSPLAAPVPSAPRSTLAGSAALEADERDGLIEGAFKLTGSSLAKTGAKTGASIFGVVRILTQAVRRALPDDQ